MSLVKAAEETECAYDFAGEIRTQKLAEKEESMREFEERLKKIQERQAEYYKQKEAEKLAKEQQQKAL